MTDMHNDILFFWLMTIRALHHCSQCVWCLAVSINNILQYYCRLVVYNMYCNLFSKLQLIHIAIYCNILQYYCFIARIYRSHIAKCCDRICFSTSAIIKASRRLINKLTCKQAIWQTISTIIISYFINNMMYVLSLSLLKNTT